MTLPSTCLQMHWEIRKRSYADLRLNQYWACGRVCPAGGETGCARRRYPEIEFRKTTQKEQR